MKIEDIKYLQAQLDVKTDGEIGPITRGALANKLISTASQDLGIIETSHNNGEGISKFWTAVDYSEGYQDRQPYCAAAVAYWIKMTGCFKESLRPRTAAAFGFENWSNRIGIMLSKPPTTVRKGDIVILKISHVGVAITDSDSKGHFSTIEANTGASGGRDGDGIYQKKRHVSSLRSVVRI